MRICVTYISIFNLHVRKCFPIRRLTYVAKVPDCSPIFTQ